MPTLTFAHELALYLFLLPYLAPHVDRWIVICGDEVSFPYDDYEAALKYGYERFGLTGFFVHKIGDDEPKWFSRGLVFPDTSSSSPISC